MEVVEGDCPCFRLLEGVLYGMMHILSLWLSFPFIIPVVTIALADSPLVLKHWGLMVFIILVVDGAICCPEMTLADTPVALELCTFLILVVDVAFCSSITLEDCLVALKR